MCTITTLPGVDTIAIGDFYLRAEDVFEIFKNVNCLGLVTLGLTSRLDPSELMSDVSPLSLVSSPEA